MNKLNDYFLTKYSFSKDDLINVYSTDYISFYNEMKNKDLVNPKSDNMASIMRKEIDKFMDEMTYSNRRRRK